MVGMFIEHLASAATSDGYEPLTVIQPYRRLGRPSRSSGAPTCAGDTNPVAVVVATLICSITIDPVGVPQAHDHRHLVHTRACVVDNSRMIGMILIHPGSALPCGGAPDSRASWQVWRPCWP